MPKSKLILIVGVFIALLPALGFPPAWDTFFQVASGLAIVFLSVWSSVDRRLVMKAKAEKRLGRKRALVEAELARENPDMYGRREADKHPAAAVTPGRRAADAIPEIRVGRRASDIPAEAVEVAVPKPAHPRRDRKVRVRDADVHFEPVVPAPEPVVPPISEIIAADIDMDDEPTFE